MPSVIDFGADPTGNTESTTAFLAAYAALPGKDIRIPAGTYLLAANSMRLNFAGTRWIGASKYSTIIRAKSGTTGSICMATDAANATTAYCGIENLHFDLNGEDCTAIDLSSVNNSAVRDCYFEGGKGFGAAATTSGSAVVTLTGEDGEVTTRVRVGQQVFGPNIPDGAIVASVTDLTHFTMSANATATSASTQVFCVAGTGVRCAAPRDAAAYTNDIQACATLYLERAFVAEDAANENCFTNCEAIACGVGFDVENGVDTVGVIRGRAEGCNIGLRTGGRETSLVGVRFENNIETDVAFLTGCERPSFVACHTATSTTTFLNENNCTGLFSRGGTFPQRDCEPNTSNPRIQAGRTTFGSAASAATFQADPTDAVPGSLTGYAGYFYDPVFLRNAAATIESVKTDKTNTVLHFSVDSSGRGSFGSYDRASAAHLRTYFGEHWSILGGLQYDGVQILGAQGAAVANASGGSTVDTEARTAINTLLARLRAHGIIAT